MTAEMRSLGCPHRDPSEPSGLLPWYTWAKERQKTHYATQCAVCGKHHVWVPFKED